MDSDECTVIMGAEGGGGGGGPADEGELIPVATLMEKAKFYTSLCLGTTAILSVFGFLFLIPFVVDPAITSIMADFEPRPVTCVTVSHVYAEGLRNCSWASCREGCTSAALRCHQILVNYSRRAWAEEGARRPDEWDVADTRLLVNTEGCGYPPRVNCSEFARRYGRTRSPFPCYYSHAYPELVVARYSWDDTLKYLILSLVVPTLLFGAAIGVLSYWYCPGCNRACHGNNDYVEKFPDKDE
ncbi:protein tipE [Bacillus rossius redtenbacheri]|uniref:protein tipE n=1 Tax=Bacillus rossius redtenbacheri TaxID=93214 RepID=UPI002FDD2D6C